MKKLILSLLAIILLIEEWLWDYLSALGHVLAVVLGLAKLEQWLMRSTPYQALVVISLPIIMVTPLNLLALWFFANGLILQGLALEIIAKLFGTLFIARFFSLSKPQLLTFRVIAWLYYTVTAWLTWARQKMQATAVYQWLKQSKHAIKAQLKHWLHHNKP